MFHVTAFFLIMCHFTSFFLIMCHVTAFFQIMCHVIALFLIMWHVIAFFLFDDLPLHVLRVSSSPPPSPLRVSSSSPSSPLRVFYSTFPLFFVTGCHLVTSCTQLQNACPREKEGYGPRMSPMSSTGLATQREMHATSRSTFQSVSRHHQTSTGQSNT